MSTIVTRAGKGSALTHNEVDANFVNLNTDKLQSGNTAAALTITSATINGGTITGTALNGTLGATTPSTAVVTSLTNSGLTSGRVTFASTGGLLADNANLFWDNANSRLGIGTTSPTEKLQVSGSSADTFAFINTTGNTKSGISLGNNGSTYGQLYFDNENNSVSLLQKYTNGSLILGTNSTERMRIDAIGHLNIGTTTGAADTSLYVYESANAARYIVMNNPNTGNASAGGLQISGGSGGDLRLVSYSSAHTTQPSNATILNHNATGSLLFGTNGLERYRIDNKGNLQNSLSMSNSLFRQVSRSGGNATETFTAADMGMSDNVTALINVSVGGTSTSYEYGGTLIYWYMPRGTVSAIQQTIVAAFKGAATSTFSISVSGNSLVVSKDSDLAVSITIIGGGGNSTI
jgi:hypothetical protein